MVKFRTRSIDEEQQQTTEEVQSDFPNLDDVPLERPMVEPVPQVDPKAGLYRKLFALQHSFTFAKDSAVNAGRMKYSFTSLSYWWNLVQDFFKRNNLYLYWETRACGSDCCAVTGTILDLDSNDSMQSTWVIPLSKKTATDKDGSPTETTDMLKDGAYLSYFQRRVVFAMCGLITGEDADAELEAAEGSQKRDKSSSTKKSVDTEGW